jgi:hypothetical protein
MSKKDADYVVDGSRTEDARGKQVAAPSVEMKKIIIHPKGPEDSKFQPVSVNGKVWQIRKGVEAVVPAFVLGVLRDAVETHFLENRTNDGDITYKDRESPRFTVEERPM